MSLEALKGGIARVLLIELSRKTPKTASIVSVWKINKSNYNKTSLLKNCVS
jgi:hypothetical protein